MGHVADNRLSAFIHCDVLYPNSLLTPASVSLERLHLRCERPGQLIEGALGTVLLGDGLHMCETVREIHGRRVNGGHLRYEHGLDLICRVCSFDHGEHEIEPSPVNLSTLPRGVGELR